MFARLVEIFKNKEVRDRILFTLVILFIFKLGATITIPNVDAASITLGTNDFFSLMNVLGGGALERFSIFALGVSPYITASIIIQLLSMGVLPALEELREQGQAGRAKIETATRYLTLLLAGVQGYGIIITMQNEGLSLISGTFTFWNYAYLILILVAGSFFMMWMADQISQKGIGNGVSMIIFAGIVAGLPNQLVNAYQQFVGLDNTSAGAIFNGILYFTVYVLSYVLLIVFVIAIEKAQRKIPVQYASSQGASAAAGGVSYLPIKVNSAGVIPVIFASSVLTAPVTILSLLGVPQSNDWYRILSIYGLYRGIPIGLMLYILMVVAFTFMYAGMQVDPEIISKNLAKSGAYVPGIRPGGETESYLRRVLNRITTVGAISLAFIASLPIVLPLFLGLPSSIAFGGTGMIILIGVALELSKEIDGRMASKDYKGLFR